MIKIVIKCFLILKIGFAAVVVTDIVNSTHSVTCILGNGFTSCLLYVYFNALLKSHLSI